MAHVDEMTGVVSTANRKLLANVGHRQRHRRAGDEYGRTGSKRLGNSCAGDS